MASLPIVVLMRCIFSFSLDKSISPVASLSQSLRFNTSNGPLSPSSDSSRACSALLKPGPIQFARQYIQNIAGDASMEGGMTRQLRHRRIVQEGARGEKFFG